MIDNENELDYQIYKSYEILGMIGKGTYGQVYKVRHKKSNQIFAIKKICDVYQNITDAKRTYRELNYLFQLQHPCIVKLYQVISTNKKASGPFNRQTHTSRTQILKGLVSQQSNGYVTQKVHDTLNSYNNKFSKHVYALFQYIQTDLSKALRICRMQIIQRKYITFQLLHGLTYLHKSKLIHRDIKPSNILIDSNCDVKICDFGLCRLKQNQIQQNNQQNIITQYVASRWYRPPEILLGSSPCNEAIDMWGIGCVMAELILRQPLFQGGTTMDQLQKIFRLIGLPTQQDIARIQTEHAKFILRNFTFSRKNKPQKINEVLNQASDQQLDLIQKLLKFNPQERFSAEKALKHSYFSQMKQMNYNFDSYGFPVKITDHTEPSTFLSELKVLNYEDKKKYGQKINKKKQITLQQYQVLIEQLQRVTSWSSNRNPYQYQYKKQDAVIQNQSKEKVQKYSEQYLKEKSTRQSNFLLEHKKNQKQTILSNYSKINVQNHTILQNYQIQKQIMMKSTEKIINYVKQNRNAYSTNDNYAVYPQQQVNCKTIADNFLQKQSKRLANIIGYNNKKIQENLEQLYGKAFNPFEKPIRKTVHNTKNSSEKLSQNQRFYPKCDKGDSKKNINKSKKNFQTNNKSKSKLQDYKNSSTLYINAKSSSINYDELIEQNKHKHASFNNNQTSTININQKLYKTKNSSNSFKKTNLKDESTKFKESSKSKYFSGGSNKSTNKITNLKSPNDLKNDNSLNKLSNKRERKKSKQLIATIKVDENISKQSFYKHTDNCFSKIEINSKKQNDFNSNAAYGIKIIGVPKDSNKNSTKDLKKTTTLQKKNKKNPTSKSIGKKKSQPKFNQNK